MFRVWGVGSLDQRLGFRALVKGRGFRVWGRLAPAKASPRGNSPEP